MRWQDLRRSRNVEDRRGESRGGGLRFPARMGGSGGRMGGSGGRIGGVGLVVLILAGLFFGVDPMLLLEGEPSPSGTYDRAPEQSAQDREMRDFVSAVLGDTEETWHQLFGEKGGTFEEPTVVLYTNAIQSACGLGEAAMGPFYCPPDRRIYIDLSFFDDLRQRFRAPGDFAQAYVIAHEVGHHVQLLLGTSARVHEARQRLPEAEANALSVRLELQADCFAGVWAHHAETSRQAIEEGDIEEALRAASAIGDDRLQRQAGGRVVPDSFTHGSSAQRVGWFRRGYETGAPEACDTFGGAAP
jgi:predicted metalloprotease